MWSKPELLRPADAPKLAAISHAYWIFDWDGTLIDLAPSPQAIQVPEELLRHLAILHEATQGRVAIVSGRSLPDLETYCPLPQLTLIGNHGAEWRHRHQRWTHEPDPAALSQLDAARAILQDWQVQYPQAQLEDKKWTLSFHFRQVSPDQWEELQGDIAELPHRLPQLQLRPAQACWEVRPQGAPTKGDAVAHLLQLTDVPATPIIFGDDWTDEDAFAAADSHALTIIIGSRRPTRAHWYLPSPHDLRTFLHHVVQAL